MGSSKIAILQIMLLAFIPTVIAVDLTPLDLYETNQYDFNLTLGGSTTVITELTANLPGFIVQDVVQYGGWESNYTNEQIRWYDGTIETNILLALFEFSAGAPKVDADTTSSVTVITEDDQGVEQSTGFNISILNDNTAPLLSGALPANGSYLKEGDDQPVEITALDPETGILEALFDFELCIIPVNESDDNSDSISLTETTADTYVGDADTSGYQDADIVCFDFNVENNGGEIATQSGILIVDGIPPGIDLLSPAAGVLLGAADGFMFYVYDNLAPTLDCRFLSDGTVNANLTVYNGDNATVPALDVDEGEHDWSVSCQDLAGWETTSETRSYILDKTPPTVEFQENGSIIAAGTTVSVTVTDNYALGDVTYVLNGGNTTTGGAEITLDTTDWPDGANTLQIYAEDSVGNQVEVALTIIVDRTPPVVTLLSPSNDSDVDVEMTFNADDTYDPLLSCQLLVDGSVYQEIDNITDVDTTFSQSLPVGDYAWSVSCIDDAGNIGDSDTWNLTVEDRTPPVVKLDNPEVIFRGDELLLSLTAEDVSGIGAVYGALVGPNSTTAVTFTNAGGDNYTATVPTTVDWVVGTYTVLVDVEDIYGNAVSTNDTLDVTYSYTITLSLDPSTVYVGNGVSASGIVTFDNGDMIPQNTITLTLPSGDVDVTVDNGVNGTGAFSQSFTAPSNSGTYKITASSTANNGYAFTADDSLQVNAKSSKKGGSSGGSRSTGSSGCNQKWVCDEWSDCADGEQTRQCREVNCGAGDNYRSESQRCMVEIEDDEDKVEDVGDGKSGYVEESDSDDNSPSGFMDEENETVEDTTPISGIGKASGFLNMSTLDNMSIFMILLLVLAIMLSMVYFGWNKDFSDKKRSRKSLEDYLEVRNR